MTRYSRFSAIAVAAMVLAGVPAQAQSAQPPLGAKPKLTEAECQAARAQLTTATDHATMNHGVHQATLSACGDPPAGPMPTSAGQAAFGAIGEVVRLLKADPATVWSSVNIEALRQHLIDMDELTMRSTVTQRPVTGGLEIVITGAGRTADAIKRMATNHGKMLGLMPEYAVKAVTLDNGARLTVTARTAADARTVALIRGLGFAGLFTEGDHHAPHHLLLARGAAVHKD